MPVDYSKWNHIEVRNVNLGFVKKRQNCMIHFNSRYDCIPSFIYLFGILQHLCLPIDDKFNRIFKRKMKREPKIEPTILTFLTRWSAFPFWFKNFFSTSFFSNGNTSLGAENNKASRRISGEYPPDGHGLSQFSSFSHCPSFAVIG